MFQRSVLLDSEMPYFDLGPEWMLLIVFQPSVGPYIFNLSTVLACGAVLSLAEI